MTNSANAVRWAILLIAGIAVAAFMVVAMPAAAAKKKGGGVVDITKAVNQPIPDAQPGATGLDGTLTSIIDVGTRFKGKRVRDVNVTVQTLGTSGATPTNDLDLSLVAPNGAATMLLEDLSVPFGSTMSSIGPLTLDDEARLGLGSGTPTDPSLLYAPWAGTAAPDGTFFQFDNGTVRGTWVLQVVDDSPADTNNLVSWRLTVVAGRPHRTK